MAQSNRLVVFLYQFVGYLWHLCLFVIVIPYLLVRLSEGLDYLVFELVLKVDVMGWWDLIPTTVSSLVSLVVIAVGLLILLESTLTLYEKARAFPFTTIPHEHLRPRQLATGGWYGRVRHPMLLGYLVVLLGVGIWFHLLTMILWWVPLFGGLMLEYSLRFEERDLSRWFGEEYQLYQREVPALIPRVRFHSVSRSD